MFFAKIKTADSETQSNLYFALSEYYRDTFNPYAETLYILPFKVSGETYQERKESARNLAIDFQYNNDGDTDIQLSYYELGTIGKFFETVGRRYGLLREFRENCIC